MKYIKADIVIRLSFHGMCHGIPPFVHISAWGWGGMTKITS